MGMLNPDRPKSTTGTGSVRTEVNSYYLSFAMKLYKVVCEKTQPPTTGQLEVGTTSLAFPKISMPCKARYFAGRIALDNTGTGERRYAASVCIVHIHEFCTA